ncbi:ribulose-phosphate 3-epimerase [Flavihumibacter rivuli]|uniref:ribulose-phosphate 3-epimerase n=1 Tax=Flavihumibacter rivuli TaxID=2838156 RepID=UPI001BDE10B3|nr:ribulose-phosphate 3-epimerase [Flavihumibacter rivuli]ULQ57254.1 ribulose-phosphate 3-epimerase [Flavihumibacter rivuli]
MIVSPSLLASDFLNLGAECKMLNESEADWFHLDIMDGSFVPNISYGLPVVEQIRKATMKICDVHLMIEAPDRYIEAFRKAGADILTVHIEACRHLHRTIQEIKKMGMIAGVALNPHTPVQLLQDILQDIDLVLIMTVNPGFGGQKFIPHTLNKVKMLRQRIDQLGLDVKIEVDGGVTLENAQALADAGADILVAGSSIFNAPDPSAAIASFKKISRQST